MSPELPTPINSGHAGTVEGVNGLPWKLPKKVPGYSTVASEAARAGIIAASGNFAATFARGLLPRSVGDQAVATGVTTAAMYQAATMAHAAAQTFALYTTGTHGMRGRTPDPTRTLVADLTVAAFGATVDQLLPPRPDEPLVTSITRFAAQTLMVGGAAGGTVATVDFALKAIFPNSEIDNRPLLVDAGIGGAIAGFTIWMGHQRAHKFGLVDPERVAVKRAGTLATLKAAGIGLAAAAGMLVLVSGEQFVASSIKRLLNDRVSRFDIGSPIVGHAVALGLLGAAGVGGFSVVKRRVEIHGNIVEAAYPEPPRSSHVTAGPTSIVDFGQIGMEGRRFVLMALTPQAITEVMGPPAIEPVRVVAGFEAAPSTRERAELCLREMDAVGAFDRSIICIASPTGVGYVSYTFAEALEYLTFGDCAIVVPQYALVPSFLAIFDTHDGVNLQRLVIEKTHQRIASMPEGSRPKLVQFGESLGAQVALDIGYPNGAHEFDRLGLEAGLYFGVPFRSATWNSWRNAQQLFDPLRSMVLLNEPAQFRHYPERRRNVARHLMIVHDDDPVNKFTYRLIVKCPWWMGPPATRPPKVPRETIWRPVTTFVLTGLDLINGMDFKPGIFVRRGHDYRIDSRLATMEAFGLTCTPEQAEAIEAALRQREQDWATRRLVAKKFAGARDSVARTLKAWGVKAPNISLDQFGMPEVADINPTADAPPHNPHS